MEFDILMDVTKEIAWNLINIIINLTVKEK